ncbi:hypothetical protein GCM10007860_15170 [Chitiniphilus shinanonensis]|uniref:Lipoprotein n=1 Tax=Chitiniphilus shinanonensis TaxID=553088 RepID=A0ABQ6BT40_9NEIS|nr:hypothetical protein [Chitiniphilus shinanonensis]GLS04370.1 hypothetical protein GCM10007860_15170 [Chitiniphilus shinanonensis]
MPVRLSRLSILALLLLGACTTPRPPVTATVPLGDTQRVTELFSYPNCLDQCPTPAPTLTDTVQHWLALSVKRDGYADGEVEVAQEEGQVVARLRGVPADYGQTIRHFLASGQLGYADAQKVQQAGQWQPSWHFFLPLGFAMRNNPSVQLLHFPPDTVMTQTQDYLQAATTRRWASLLVNNGVTPSATDPYQTIVDIAPIAAPANAGGSLEGVYDDFSDYTVSLLGQWTAGADGVARPLVAFGGPARQWLAQYYKLPPIKVLGLTRFQPVPGRTVQAIGANHPSYIWYAADPKQYGGNQQEADAAGIRVMGQDLTAACWQVAMAAQPQGDPAGALGTCQQRWPVGGTQVCQQFYISIRNLSPEQARAKCLES